MLYENINFYFLNHFNNVINSSNYLIIADPQILGKEFNNCFLDFIAIWDSDRYLYLAYWYAFTKTKPKYVIFLGDLMDQGSKADNITYNKYVERFQKIFPLYESQGIYVDGDNDVFEINYLPVITNVARFQNNFPLRDTISAAPNFCFKIINFLDYQNLYSKSQDTNAEKNNQINIFSTNSTNILLSHMTILTKDPLLIEQIARIYSPNLILSGDLHTSRIIYRRIKNSKVEGTFVQNFETSISIKFFLSNDQTYIYEISVPSINYRMGYEKTGIGVLNLHLNDSNNLVATYRVIWLPYRFRQLLVYMPLSLLIILFLSKYKFTLKIFK
ncbi:unnamed protein product [Gordionus sp. m RMFG-2023]